jgi:DNA modification methylase
MNEPIAGLSVQYRSIDSLRPYSRNARTHSAKQIEQIAASIREFGFTNPILIDQNGVVIAGHGRLDAGKLIGMSQVPTIQLEHLTEPQIRAYVLADNRLAEKAGWDPNILVIEFQYLSELDLEFDLEITGFGTAEIDFLIERSSKTPSIDDEADQLPSPQPQLVSRIGDAWKLGENRLVCGDARDLTTCRALLGGERARMMFTDPPYNVSYRGHIGRSIAHEDFAMAHGEMTRQQFKSFLARCCANAAEVSLDGAIHFIFMDWRHMQELLEAGASIYSEMKNLCVWNKTNGGMGSFYRSKHELVFVFKVGTGAHLNTIELGRSGRYRTNVWDYAGVNAFRSGRMDDLAIHPTVKPVALVVDAIKDCTRRNDIVFDPFAGSGTTILAAQKAGRRARAIEIDPAYVDVSIRRWEKLVGLSAVHEASGRTFADVAAARADGTGEENNPRRPRP